MSPNEPFRNNVLIEMKYDRVQNNYIYRDPEIFVVLKCPPACREKMQVPQPKKCPNSVWKIPYFSSNPPLPVQYQKSSQ